MGIGKDTVCKHESESSHSHDCMVCAVRDTFVAILLLARLLAQPKNWGVDTRLQVSSGHILSVSIPDEKSAYICGHVICDDSN